MVLKTRRAAVDPVEREAINETRRRFYEGLALGMSHDAAVAYSKGKDVAVMAVDPKQEGGAGDGAHCTTCETREAQRAVDLTGWDSLPYIPREAGAPNLKALASQVSNSPIRNKKEAEAAIQAEIALRAKEDAEANAAVAISDGWESLSGEERIALASKLTTEEVKTEGDAERVIQIELARRAAAA